MIDTRRIIVGNQMVARMMDISKAKSIEVLLLIGQLFLK